MIVHTFVATVIFPEIVISAFGVILSISPVLSTPTIPNDCSTQTIRCDRDSAESTTKGILYVLFDVITVSVPELNGDCDILIYL